LFASALDERIKYPEVSRIVANINASVRAMELLFNALLDISRLDAGVLQPSVRHFRLDELIRRLVNDHAPEAERKGLKLLCSACEVTVHSDPALLERIVLNFVSNAIRYTDRGEVRITCAADGDQVRVEVTDTGIGIPPDKHREIFDEFHQLQNPNRDRNKGLGLGLAIVDRVARLLGHRIEVQSTPGKGSCFTVLVPLGDALCVVEEPSRAVVALDDVGGLHVVVVDDEIDIREGMQSLLQQWGCQVSLAASAAEAVAVARAADVVPHAIIADYRLRDGETGVQVIEQLQRELEARIPALIVTGDTASERLQEAGASGYQLVHKPVQPAMLRAFLRNVSRRNAAP
jgi:CheY-like chemotaxis protein/anti-sigma regulatory factor (Ser/Thr protein kinase)